MNKLLSIPLAIAGAFTMSACASYSDPEVSYRAGSPLGVLAGVAQQAENAVNNPSVGVIARGGLVNGEAKIEAERNNPVDLTPNVQTEGSFTIGSQQSNYAKSCRNIGGEIISENGLEKCIFNSNQGPN